MKQTTLFLKDKQTFHEYVILEFLSEDRELARVRPGQFFMLGANTLLKKPISVLDSDPKSGTIRFLVRRVGKGTAFHYDLAPGTTIDVVGPAGNTFPVPDGKVLMVGGGSGIPPLFFLAKELDREQYMVVYGGRDDTEIVPLFGKSMSHRITTDDGSLGLKGTVVDGVRKVIADKPAFADAVIYSCGPEAMVNALTAAFPENRHLTSLERYMGCGYGVCLGCVVQTVDGYKRVCVDGPVFDVKELKLDD